MTYIKLCLSDENTLLNELKKYEGMISKKIITEKFKILSKNIIEINNDKISRKTINTIKWIDDILDLYARNFKCKFSIMISENIKDLNQHNVVEDKFILFNPSKEILSEFYNWSLIKILDVKSNYVKFDFDFYSALEYSKNTTLKTSRGIATIQAVEVESHKKLFTILKVGNALNSVNLRIHYMCETSEIFDSLHCDCNAQLKEFKDMMFKDGGILIYAHEEGRGFGLTHKLNAYYNTEHMGLDTVDAMIKETGKAENRLFEIPADIIFQLKIKSVNLWTNNPLKINPLLDRGIIVNRINSWSRYSPKESQKYINDKKGKMNHYENIN